MKPDSKALLRNAAYPVIEALEGRRLLSSSLPFTLDFDSAASSGLQDKDGEIIGFTHVQQNPAGTAYQPALLDLLPAQGLLNVTSGPGSNWHDGTSLDNGLVIEFDASTAGFVVTAALRGPLSNIDAAYEQAGIMFGPDQDNYVKLVAIARPGGQYLQFVDEQTTGGTYTHTVDQLTSIGAFSALDSLELRLVGDAVTGKVSAHYAVNGGDFTAISGSTVTLSGAKKAEFFASAARAGLIVMHSNSIGPVTVSFDRFEVRHRPAISASDPGEGQSDVRLDAFVGADLFLPNGALDPSTVDSSTVKLFKTSTGALVASSVNTSGGGDSIVLQPTSVLEPNTQYTFTVSEGVQDVAGVPLLPHVMSFTTGTDGGPADSNIEFEKVLLPSTGGNTYTSVTIGPDGKLYAGTIDGRIVRFPINPDGTLGTAQQITSLVDHYGGPRLMEGFAFDPASTPSNLIIWATHSFFSFDDAPEWSSGIARLSGPDLATVHDAVVGLPRSAHNHLTNQPVFGPVEADGKQYLYFTQAGNTAQGAMDSTWGLRPERLLSAAMLRLDTFAIAPGATLNVQTEELGAANYDPWAPGAPLTIYATGLRNAYDIVWTHDGFLYAPNNGSNAGGATPGTPQLPILGSIRIDGDDDGDPTNGMYSNPAVPGINPLNLGQPDHLYNVVRGGYYGHPNPSRAEFVLQGGNPTSGTDPNEIKSYPVGTLPDRNYRGVAFNFGAKYSPNGIMEFRGNAFGGELDGSLMVVRFSGGDDVVILKRGPDGSIIEQQSGIPGLTGLSDPLDITQDPGTGFVYVAEYGGGRITLLRPVAAPAAPPSNLQAIGTGPTRVVLSWNHVPTASSYRIQRRAPGESLFSDYALVTAPTFTDTSATALQTYEYKVRAQNNGGVSPYSPIVSATTGAPGAWLAGVSLPENTAEAGGDIINGKMYITGESTPDTWEFDFATGVWTAKAVRPFTGDVSNAEHSTHAVNGKLYLIGGLSGGAENKVQIYDPATDTWSLGADRPWNAGSSPSALINGEIYVAGGAISSPYGPVNRVAKYNPLTDTWTELAPMPSPRHATLAATDGTRLWIFGGRDKGLEASDGTNTVQVYNPATNTWSTSANLTSGLAPLPRPVRGASATYINGEFYVFGGENSSGGHGATPDKVFDRVDIYNPQTNTWRLGRPMPTARHATIAVPHAGRVYLVGGGVVSGTSFSSEVEIFDPAANPAPVAPTGLAAITMSPSEIALGWNQSSDNEVTFEILRSLDGQTFLQHDTARANVTTYSDTDVVDGTTYYYVVRAVNATGASANSNQASAVAGDPQPPAAPGGLTADAVSATRIQLAWNPSVGATSYRIERQGPLDSGFILVGTTAQSSYLDLGLTKDTTYNYRVQAVNHVGLSGYSSTATATTPESVPLASLDINTSVSGSTTVITEGRDYDITAGGVNIWGTADSFRYVYGDFSGDFDVLVQVTGVSMERVKVGLMARESLAPESRHVYASISSGDSHRLATRIATGGSTSNLFNAIDPVLPNVWLRLKRVGDQFIGYYGTDGANWTEMARVTMAMGHAVYLGMAVSAQSTTGTGTVMLRNFGDVPGVAPATPTGLAGAAQSHTRIDLGWNPSAGASAYRLQRRTGGGEFSDIALVAATSFSDTGLAESTTYEYRLIAENEFGASHPSASVFITTPPAPTAPGAPTGVQALTFSHSQIDISWDASAGATSYSVQRRAFGGAFVTAVEGLSSLSFSDTNLNPSTVYEYRVIAVNAIGASPSSSVASASTDPAPTTVPNVPTGLAATPISADRVDLTWSRSTGAASYRVQRRTPGSAFADVAISVTALSFSDKGLVGNTTYEYRVLAENVHGLSGPSGEITVTTPAPSHTGVDVGGPTVTGSTTPVGPSGDAYDVFAGGTDIIGAADQFHFAHRQLTGDFDMAVRLESLTQADLWSKAGLMARAGLTAASRNVLVLASTAANNEHRFTYRLTDGGETASTGGGAVTYPNAWLRLRRQGNTFTGYRSSDGMNWVVVGTVSIDLPPTLFFGMAATSHNAAVGTTAAFRDLRPTPTPSVPVDVIAVPVSSDAVNLNWTASNGATLYLIERKGPGESDPFVQVGTTSSPYFREAGLSADTTYSYRVRAQSDVGVSAYSEVVSVHVPPGGAYVGTDIGAPAVPGSSTIVGSDGVDVVAGGMDIWGGSDQLHFHNARITGDFDFFVRVDSVSLSGSKAGLMARESLDPGSRNIFAALASDDLYRLSRRTTTGGSTSNLFKNVTPILPDAWLRLRRVGNVFTGYYSTDGAAWVQMKSISWTMPSTLYVGLAAASKSATTATTVQFRSFGEIPTSPPAAPTGLEALGVSESGIDLTWTASPGVNLYTVQRRLPGGTFEDVATGLSGTSYSDTGLAAGTTYEYQVLARNVVGLSAPSDTASATTFAPSSAPDAPTGLTVSVVTHDEARLEWNASTGASSYRVQRRAPGGVFADVAAGLTTTSFNDVGLTPGATYEYRVFAENQVGLSPPSEVVSITMPTAWVYAGTDIGGPSQAGSTTRIDDQSYSVTGGGLDIWGSADQFHFAHRQITGDFDIRVQVTSVSLSQAKAGLMARETLDAGSRNVFAGLGANDAYRLARRASTGGTTSNIFKNVTPVLPNAWLRLRRVGNVFTGFYSTDGVTWIQMGSTTLAMPQTVYFGMAVSSKSDVQTATAEFRNLGDVLA